MSASSVRQLVVGSLFLFVAGAVVTSAADPPARVTEEPVPDGGAEVAVEAADDRDRPLPVRAVVTAADGSHPDGSGHGAYGDGRFFADGRFTVRVPAGKTRVALSAGPNYEPAELTVAAAAGKRVLARAGLRLWFAPEERGWYAGDNHVHAQHERPPADGVRADLEYTALQARADGLSYVTEAGSGDTDYSRAGQLDRPGFLFRHAEEQRIGPFVGHFNTPGIRSPIPAERYAEAVRRPLPARAVRDLAHDLGGAFISTHPLVPVHQLHWMGAAEAFSDAVLGQTADLMDLDGRATEQLWFTVLNLGNRIGCSGSTDAALTRSRTPSPGDRRVYCRAPELTYTAVVEALRAGRTFATNGGPVFPFLAIAGRGPGETVPAGGPLVARVEVNTLYPLRKVDVIRRGRVGHTLSVAGKASRLDQEVPLGPAVRGDWFVLRAEDDRGHWAITSPVYVGERVAPPADACALLLEIGNFSRFAELRREFFAHLVVTVAPSAGLERVELVRDGRVVRTFRPADGDRVVGGKMPVTGLRGEYAEGWAWDTRGDRAVHLQADWPVAGGGWYHLRAVGGGRVVESDAVYFTPGTEVSRALSVAHLGVGGTSFRLRGYGEEMKLADIRATSGDHWWYPRNTYWQVRAVVGDQVEEFGGDKHAAAAGLFRPAPAR